MTKFIGIDNGLMMPPVQGLSDESTIQHYKLGTRLVLDERVYHYAKCVTTELVRGRGCITTSTPEESAVAGATTTKDVGADTVTITVQAAAGLALDALAGGYLCYKFHRHKILSHPAADNAATCVLTLETPIVEDTITSGVTTVTAVPSLWKVTKATNAAGYAHFMGFPPSNVPANSYFWCQSWGPVLACPANYMGSTQSVRDCVFCTDGSITDNDAIGTIGHPRAGTLILDSYTVNTAGTNFDDTSHLLNVQLWA